MTNSANFQWSGGVNSMPPGGESPRRGGCRRCGERTKLFRTYCPNCQPFVRRILAEYADAAKQVLDRSGPLSPEWDNLQRWLSGSGVPPQEATSTIAREASAWLNRLVVDICADGIVTDREMHTFTRATAALNLPDRQVAPLRQQLAREQTLGTIRQGALPNIAVSGLHLHSGEICHMIVGATRWRDLKSGPQATPGQFGVTNRRVLFIAPQHGGEVPLSKLQRVSYFDPRTILLEATSRSLSGRFTVEDAEYSALIVDIALRIDRRQLFTGQAGQRSRHIPPHVRNAVFQRDGGRCQQCSATEYLEFDHIIPHSMGGSNDANNIQLLCRRCNLTKGARI